MSIWNRMKESWTKEADRPSDVYDIPVRAAWAISLAALAVGWVYLGFLPLLKGYWWTVFVAGTVIGVCDLWGDWMRRPK